MQGRIKGGKRSNCPGPPAARGPPWWNLFVSNKTLVWKIFAIQKRDKNTTLYYIPILHEVSRAPNGNWFLHKFDCLPVLVIVTE